jgi:hypothetical protein
LYKTQLNKAKTEVSFVIIFSGSPPHLIPNQIAIGVHGWAFAFSLARSLVFLTSKLNHFLNSSKISLKVLQANGVVLDVLLQKVKTNLTLKLEKLQRLKHKKKL